MRLDKSHYVPCLCWKTGEFRGIDELSEATKSFLTPLVEVKEIGFQYDEKKPVPTLDEHLSSFVDNLSKKWGRARCFVDTARIDAVSRTSDGLHPLSYVLAELHKRKCRVIPVTGFNRDAAYQNAVVQSKSLSEAGVCLRIYVSSAAQSNLATSLVSILGGLEEKPENCDLVIDLGAPSNYDPIEGFVELLQEIVQEIPFIDDWRSLVLMGTSVPKSMSDVEEGLTKLARSEWLLYKRLANSLREEGIRVPSFGDYAITYPEILELDPRKITTSAKIKYTIDDGWIVMKGKSLKKSGYAQYRYLCNELMRSDYFLGRDFSEGDSFIVVCACGGKTGNPTSWVKAGTNHHVEKVVVDLANFFDSSTDFEP